MKKLMIAMMLGVLCTMSYAAPNKADTIEYIDSWLQKNILGKNEMGSSAYYISEIKFTGDQLITSKNYVRNKQPYSKDSVKDIRWEFAKPRTNGNYVYEHSIVNYLVTMFENKMISTVFYYRENEKKGYAENELSWSFVDVKQIDEKEIANLNRAVTHLVELSKAEANKKSAFFEK